MPDDVKTKSNSDPVIYAQSLPQGQEWILLTPASAVKRSGSLEYQNPKTGQKIIVPNVPYNQPVSLKIEAARFYESQYRKSADQLSRFKSPYWQSQIEKALHLAEMCRKEGDRLASGEG